MDNKYKEEQFRLLAVNKTLMTDNEALRQINKSLVDAINQNDEERTSDLVWMTRDEMKDYSDVHQAGGINAIKANAIIEMMDSVPNSGFNLASDLGKWIVSYTERSKNSI